MQFLTCEPNLTHKVNYTDEADIFEKDPEAWLQYTFGGGFSHTSVGMTGGINGSQVSYDPTRESRKPLPSHIIMYNVLRIRVKGFLAHHHYQLCHDLFNSHIDDGRRSKRMLIFCKVLKV